MLQREKEKEELKSKFTYLGIQMINKVSHLCCSKVSIAFKHLMEKVMPKQENLVHA